MSPPSRPPRLHPPPGPPPGPPPAGHPVLAGRRSRPPVPPCRLDVPGARGAAPVAAPPSAKPTIPRPHRHRPPGSDRHGPAAVRHPSRAARPSSRPFH